MSNSPQLHVSEEFARFLEKPTRESFRGLLQTHLGEYDYLDFKEDWPEKTKIAKSILAFANSGTGCLILGVAESEDGTFDVKGLQSLKDKTKLKDSLQGYVPQSVGYDVFDFEYKSSEYSNLIGKKFQILLVKYNENAIPVLSLAAGGSLHRNRIYIRHNDSTREADHEQVQRLIDKRINRSQQTPKSRELKEHLSELKELYRQRVPDLLYLGRADSISMTGYYGFLDRMIKHKQSIIEKLLGLTSSG